VYYAYEPSTGTFWAVAEMEPLPSAPVSVLVKFQDGANRAIFSRTGASGWSVVSLVGEPPCYSRDGLPSVVQSLWGLVDGPDCQS
jgi:hypothetical protein